VPVADAGVGLPRFRPDAVDEATLDIFDDGAALQPFELLAEDDDVVVPRRGLAVIMRRGVGPVWPSGRPVSSKYMRSGR
jgi:hypothetical protein